MPGTNLTDKTGTKRTEILTSYQELLLSPIYRYKMPQFVPKGQKIQFDFVYHKFTLGKNEKLKVKLDELNGDRDVAFRIK